ncbi:MAG: sugar phosphate isomerase/epimerase [Hoeflea sp.]|uniref:sugar phosphate isomerase/epimerase family protein n=1 Tax=Hoeflea sp. TaxID=1940281 RepID=UPI001DD09313|nr:sugar phosphate isomerase/epimerase family protein [Hoeflea sp.]MBU4528467.1 sugar phosphate isomerase/epimerase [Alphaproteobacteria bacterium]MBU4543136.1 sugar phosphate isomerase/epimerase [Alphaproteobacteria bacterium]MBU4551827.1 sugar phosphate isomerase/epimerase [Alphaproteobacteria bacterium]MBV1723722.1 sugar phosphate isomerase/epimerase [Hoeflea sp.]MBV1762038.1 sugar phosphate isomerase/epimerase [Hoeflea sp.]
MTLPLLGAAVTLPTFTQIQDWICGPGRAIEIQDFCGIGVLERDHSDLIAAWQAVLPAHTGERGIHGPFFGLDISTPDREVRAIVQKRMMQALEVAEALEATHMVIHSPFTHWHQLNRANYPAVYPSLMDCAADCLAPVLDRAAGIGCTLMLENCDDTDPAARVDMVRQIGHANLKVSLDTGHADIVHGRYDAPHVVDFIAAASGHLGHVHLQDVDGYADRHWHPGDGRIAWRPVFEALAALKESPRLMLEVRTDLPRLPATVARLEAMGLAC